MLDPAVVAWIVSGYSYLVEETFWQSVDRIPLVDVYMVKIPESKRNYGPTENILGTLYVFVLTILLSTLCIL